MKLLKIVLKLIGNVIIGGIALHLINLIGSYFTFHVNINIISSFITGLLGIPGVMLLVALRYLFRI